MQALAAQRDLLALGDAGEQDLAGVSAGETVIVEAPEGLKDGAKVEVKS